VHTIVQYYDSATLKHVLIVLYNYVYIKAGLGKNLTVLINRFVPTREFL